MAGKAELDQEPSACCVFSRNRTPKMIACSASFASELSRSWRGADDAFASGSFFAAIGVADTSAAKMNISIQVSDWLQLAKNCLWSAAACCRRYQPSLLGVYDEIHEQTLVKTRSKLRWLRR